VRGCRGGLGGVGSVVVNVSAQHTLDTPDRYMTYVACCMLRTVYSAEHRMPYAVCRMTYAVPVKQALRQNQSHQPTTQASQQRSQGGRHIA
jgi:hypothetical protein